MKHLLAWWLVFCLAWSPCRAGWVLGSDSDRSGMLKVFRGEDGTVVVQRCEDKQNCKEVVRHDSTTFAEMVHYVELAGIASGGVILSALATLAGISAFRILRNYDGRKWVLLLNLLIPGGLYYLAVDVSSNIESHWDYLTIYGEDFLTDDERVILLAEDTVDEIFLKLH